MDKMIAYITTHPKLMLGILLLAVLGLFFAVRGG